MPGCLQSAHIRHRIVSGHWRKERCQFHDSPIKAGLVNDTKNGWENHHAIHGKINELSMAILRDFMGFYAGLMGFYGGLMGKSTMSTGPFSIAMQQITRG